MKYLLVFTLLILSLFTANAQSRKKADKNNLFTEIVWSTNDQGIKVKETYTRFDKNGNTIEEIEYDETGTKIKTHKTYLYDTENDMTEERFFTPANKLLKFIRYKYNAEKKVIEETHCNAAGKVDKTVKYTYNGTLKQEKNIYDAAGKLRKKKTYVYEKYAE